MTTPDPARATWRKSTYSGGTGGNCIEVTPLAGLVAIRDSQNPDGPVLLVSHHDWHTFTAALQASPR